MELSPHIYSEPSPEAASQQGMQENSRTAEKDGLGVFSKLLAGLLGKAPTPGTGGIDIDKTPEIEGSPELIPETGIKGGKNAKGLSVEPAAIPQEGENPVLSRDIRGQKKPVMREVLPGPSPKQKTPAEILSEDSTEGNPEGAFPWDTLKGQGIQLLTPREEGVPQEGEALAGAAFPPEGELPKEGTVQEDAPKERRMIARKHGEDGEAQGDLISSLDRRDLKPTPQVPPSAGQGRAKKEGEPRSGDSKARERRHERVSLEVQDLRTPGTTAAITAGGLKAVEEARNSGGEAEIAVELRGVSGKNGDIPVKDDARPAQAFENILARELHENLNGDIVRQASLVLKDGGEGTIKLSLKPESLGKVKIHLEMAENKITGHIVVETNEALRAFEQEMHALEQAFQDSGFEGASLKMALDSRGGQDAAGQRWNGEEARPFFSERVAASTYDAAVESAGIDGVSGGYIRSSGSVSVNMLV